jgi:hypothetical protein
MNKLIYLLIFFTTLILSQEAKKIVGIVSFISSQYAYIKFPDTDLIDIGDTLYFFINNKSAGIVEFKSSISVAAKPLAEINVNDSIYALSKIENRISESNRQKLSTSLIKIDSDEKFERNLSSKQKNYHLRMSIQSFNDLSEIKSNSRYKYIFNLDYDKFIIDKIKLNSYFTLNYNNKIRSTSDKLRDLLKIYQLSLELNLDVNQKFKFGRSFNDYLFSIGSIDGVQYHLQIGKFTLGVIAGSRPDNEDYWFNSSLIQVGTFINRIDTINKSIIDNTISIIEQTNKFNTDRRLIYLQHRNDLIPFTRFFLSSEIDFYLFNKGKFSKTTNISSFYGNLNFKPMRQLALNLSYDSRRNVYYLSDFKNYIDSLLENELRQGFKISTIIRPVDFLYVTMSYSSRNKIGDVRTSKSYGGSIGFNNLPYINLDISSGVNFYNNIFFNGYNFNISLLKNLSSDLMIMTNYKQYQIKFNNSQNQSIDKFIELSLIINFLTNLNLSINFEKAIENSKFSILMLDITSRF